MTCGGYILTGGAARRMGREKACLRWAGTSLVEFVASRLREAGTEPVLVGRPAVFARLGLPSLGERHPGCGPLSGFQAALRHSPHPWNLIVSCDLPHLEARLLRLLLKQASRTSGWAVVPQKSDGRLQPLCAVYHARCLPSVEKALETRKLKVRDWLAEVSFEIWDVPPDLELCLTNVNTPADWAAAQSSEPQP